MPKVLKVLLAAYAALMGGVIGWAWCDFQWQRRKWRRQCSTHAA